MRREVRGACKTVVVNGGPEVRKGVSRIQAQRNPEAKPATTASTRLGVGDLSGTPAFACSQPGNHPRSE